MITPQAGWRHGERKRARANRGETWRDYDSGKLTDEQRRECQNAEEYEKEHNGRDPQDLTYLAERALKYVRDRIVTGFLETRGDGPNPAGAMRIEDWDTRLGIDGCIEETMFREFFGSLWPIGDVHVQVEGVEHGTGKIERWVAIHGDTASLAPGVACELAQALAAAADEVEQMNEADKH